MGTRHPNPRLVKIHRNYTVEEVALLLGVHKNTVREWIKRGLPTTDDRRPKLILGRVLAAFLRERRRKNKRPCQPGQLYCVRCRAPKAPAGGLASYRPLTETLGDLTANCPDCNARMNRRVNLAKMEQVRGRLSVTMPEAQRRISQGQHPSVNSDLR